MYIIEKILRTLMLHKTNNNMMCKIEMHFRLQQIKKTS